MSVLGIGGVVALTLGMCDAGEGACAYVAGQVVEVRGKRYRVTGFTDEGEPRLTRIDP